METIDKKPGVIWFIRFKGMRSRQMKAADKMLGLKLGSCGLKGALEASEGSHKILGRTNIRVYPMVSGGGFR
jgi:hypothetical protein